MATQQATQHLMSIHTLHHHLKVAREMYLDTAQTMRDAGLETVAKQFDLQAQECETWAEALMDSTSITVPHWYDGEVIMVETD